MTSDDPLTALCCLPRHINRAYRVGNQYYDRIADAQTAADKITVAQLFDEIGGNYIDDAESLVERLVDAEQAKIDELLMLLRRITMR